MAKKPIPSSLSMWTILGVLTLISTGCGVDYFRAEIILHSDGSIDRAIYQPKKETPKTAQNPKIWKVVTWSDEIKTEEWRGSIRDLPLKKESDDDALTYFALSIRSDSSHLGW